MGSRFVNFTLIAIGLTAAFYIGLRQPTSLPYSSSADISPISNAPTPSVTNPRPCTPTFADGGGPYYQPNSPYREQLAPPNHNGQSLTVSGRVFQNDCRTPVANAVIDIWHANENGSYEQNWYRGKIVTDSQGHYTFSSIIPKGYGEGTAMRPPHIHFKIFIQNQEIITSQMFFPDVQGRFESSYIMTLTNGASFTLGHHDIILP